MSSKVLIVDLASAALKELSAGLTKEGIAVESCDKGLSAIEKIEQARKTQKPFTAVILGTRLPDLEGVSLVRALKAVHPALTVGVITAATAARLREQLQAAGADRVYAAPVTAAQLAADFKALPGSKIEAPAAAPSPAAPRAYVFVRGKPGDELAEGFPSVCQAAGVLSCDAVLGSFDMVAVFEARDRKAAEGQIQETLKAAPGIDKFDIRYTEVPALSPELAGFLAAYSRARAARASAPAPDGLPTPEPLAAYLVVEVEAAQLPTLAARFALDESVLGCDWSDAGKLAVLRLGARSFDAVHQAIGRLQRLPGVMRAKALPVMKVLNA